ncbi:hypothetical protein SAMN04515665_10932 [Blastococcus sp. DSM 46786]|uniref:DUF6542 domain-containing protein n=1 Tax=Blastococcus sp. DSM 46786 TaxID=1798227 RepID=UPI0008B2A16E|nr:DUF6542 domain-containing protein [Blastococcus sp. DSM 46786]SEL16542.1 hypothetical protein SAMN04515665_10932 [Blastococcus sp. DSM 46786]
MATASTAGAWQGGGRPERPYPARAPRPPAGSERPGRPARPARAARPPVPGRAGERLRAAEREYADDRFDRPEPSGPRRREPGPPRPTAGRPAQDRARSRIASPASTQGSRLRGSLAVLGVFLLTLAGGAVDSFFGIGLGMITLVALAAGTSAATLLVRRRDLLTVVVAPPLVFTLVAVVNIALAPSATLNLPTMATLLVRGFPTMAVATAIAAVLAVVRLVSRR